MIVVDYDCPNHGRFEIIEDHEPQDDRPCGECGEPSPYVFPAPSIKPNYASVTQGKGDTDRPKGFVSTEALADGMSQNDFKAAQSAARKERLRQHVKSKL